MCRWNWFLMSVLCALWFAQPAAAGPAAGNEEWADRSVYNRLLNEIRRTDAEYAQALGQAMGEAREGKGEASLQAQAKIIELRDKRDRLMNRCILLSVRHGWEMPKIGEPDPNPVAVSSAKDKVFEPATYIIKGRFAKEARQIAAALTLPVVSVDNAF